MQKALTSIALLSAPVVRSPRRHAVFLDHRRVGMREGSVLSHGRSRTNRQLRPGAGASRAT